MFLIITSPAPKVKWIKLNRREKRNALCQDLMQELQEEINIFEQGDDHVLVISGDDDCFSAGVDLREIYQETQKSMREKDKIGSMWEAVSRCSKPVIACVSGMAYGGGFELALMCDIITASKTAVFKLPELTVGTIPGIGGSVRLTHLIGPKATSSLIFQSASFSAQRAYDLGVVSHIFEDLIPQTLELAKRIANQSLPLLQKTKQAIRSAINMEQALETEKQLFYSTFDLAEQKELMRSFLKIGSRVK